MNSSNVNIIKASIKTQNNWELIENFMVDKLKCSQNIEIITFCEMYFYKKGKPIENPWIGIVHDPPQTSKYYLNKNLLSNTNFIESIPYCRGLFCMSNELKSWLKNELNPSFFLSVLFHPIPRKNLNEFDFKKFEQNKQIIQIGNWLRKPYSIFKLKTKLKKMMIPYEDRMKRELKNFSKRDKIKISAEEDLTVTKCNKISDEYYNDLFRNNIIYLDLYASTCNNVILECIKTNCPIIINRLPSIEAYLGKDYPLFFDNIEQLQNDFINDEKIMLANEYLKNLDKSRFTINYFISCINNKLRKLVD